MSKICRKPHFHLDHATISNRILIAIDFLFDEKVFTLCSISPGLYINDIVTFIAKQKLYCHLRPSSLTNKEIQNIEDPSSKQSQLTLHCSHTQTPNVIQHYQWWLLLYVRPKISHRSSGIRMAINAIFTV